MLEDLCPEYKMVDYNQGLSIDQVLVSMKALAYYHAICYCYGKVENVDFKKKYDFLSVFFENFEHDKELINFMDMNMDLVVQDLEKEKRIDLIPHLKKLRKDIGPKYKRAIMDAGYYSA